MGNFDGFSCGLYERQFVIELNAFDFFLLTNPLYNFSCDWRINFTDGLYGENPLSNKIFSDNSLKLWWVQQLVSVSQEVHLHTPLSIQFLAKREHPFVVALVGVVLIFPVCNNLCCWCLLIIIIICDGHIYSSLCQWWLN